MNSIFEGVCFNSRHPGPRRAWKGGSEQQLMTPDPRDPQDLLAAPDEFQIVQKPHVLSVKADLDPPLNPPKARHSSGRPWENLWERLEELWESFGRSGSVLGGSGRALGGPGRALGGSIYTKTPDQPPQRTLCLNS